MLASYSLSRYTYLFSISLNELLSDDLSDYKRSKAYSYYCQGWLSPLHYHPIADDSVFCVLTGTGRPSQQINDAPQNYS